VHSEGPTFLPRGSVPTKGSTCDTRCCACTVAPVFVHDGVHVFPPAPPMPLSLKDSSACRAAAAGTGGLVLSNGDIPLFIRWEEYVPTYLDSVVDVPFVQVGANCGTNSRECANGGDPIWNYAFSCGWHGITIEPVRRTFEKLCQNYGNATARVRPVRAIINDVGGEGWVTTRDESSHAVHPVNASLGGADIERVPMLTLRDVWPAQGAAVLVVDAEGAEGKILQGQLPEPLPRLVLFEHAHLKGAMHRIDANLRRHNFTHLADHSIMIRSAATYLHRIGCTGGPCGPDVDWSCKLVGTAHVGRCTGQQAHVSQQSHKTHPSTAHIFTQDQE
jgi:FkbM family methyltransferase